jgi:hypothetical protein
VGWGGAQRGVNVAPTWGFTLESILGGPTDPNVELCFPHPHPTPPHTIQPVSIAYGQRTRDIHVCVHNGMSDIPKQHRHSRRRHLLACPIRETCICGMHTPPTMAWEHELGETVRRPLVACHYSHSAGTVMQLSIHTGPGPYVPPMHRPPRPHCAVPCTHRNASRALAGSVADSHHWFCLAITSRIGSYHIVLGQE